MLIAIIEICSIFHLNTGVLPGYCLRICHVDLASANGSAKLGRQRPIKPCIEMKCLVMGSLCQVLSR